MEQSFFVRKRLSRPARMAPAFLLAGGAIVLLAASPPVRFDPGLSFKVSASTRVFGGDTPRGQDDEVMRGRGIAANNHSRIEFLAYTPTPQGLTTDDFLIAVDSGRAFILHTNGQRFTPANDMFGGPAVVALGRVLGGGGRGGPPGGGGPGG